VGLIEIPVRLPVVTLVGDSLDEPASLASAVEPLELHEVAADLAHKVAQQR
jgi:hypothetical protein